MRLSERQPKILELVRRHGSCRIADLADDFGVSLETIRRDLRPMTEEGQVVKLHGTVMLPEPFVEPAFDRRMKENSEAKRAIARRLAEEIRNGDSLMMDTGSTTNYVAHELTGRRDLTIVTNSCEIGRTLSVIDSNSVYLAGGQLRADDAAAFGCAAQDLIKQFHVTYSIVSIGAIDSVCGLMDYHLEEAELSRVILSRGRHRIVVADHSKFERRGLVSVCDVEGFDVLITDRHPPENLAQRLEECGVKVVLAEDTDPIFAYPESSKP